ncbi:hypothetical protein BCR37DRAFT_377247 [Protomyces lactucae-debilis]|uniref:WSC domain-containing protein n=1 Tax=Protomyces lactucae-debilis TaxID=2754530 RepID=A0A1Y2FNM5_PROLT|nr:uncharacterized protein BCR37DRAFT_377247 [Protomyces lactucae-debilis]ORY85568.1 hypothetical protein BCR37DRAFT_377247 [Protomyces lactucae-debilis]
MKTTISAAVLLACIDSCAAFWRMGCSNPSIIERVDPIVNPGGVAGHVHNFAGASGIGPNADFQSLRASDCTSCPIVEDLSAYWTPMLYYRDQNNTVQPVANGGTTVYYLQRGGGPLKAFPAGFKMLAGNPNLRSYDGSKREQQAINYVCLDYGKGSSSSDGLPTKNCPDGLRAQIIFPSCWDGVNLDSPDHKSHVAYPTGIANGQCDDPKYPVRLVTIFYEVFYNVGDFAGQWWSDKSPFVLAQGDPTGYGLHGDFMNGWDVKVLQTAIDTCNDNSGSMEKCQAFSLKYPADGSSQCHKSPSVNEQVMGKLKKLPGCNPIWDGTGVKPACDAEPTPQLWTNTTGYYGWVTPTGYNSTDGREIVQKYKNWNYLGCYQERDARVFPKRFTPGDLTVGKCLDICQGAGYPFGGMEYSGECWCGPSLNNAQKIDMQRCYMLCSGNSSQYCGGSMALSTYQLAPLDTTSARPASPSSSAAGFVKNPALSPQVAGQYSYVGCYQDGVPRTLPSRLWAGDGSVSACAKAALDQLFPYMGQEYGGECWASDVAPTAALRPDSECSFGCKGNSSEQCGGSVRLQTYKAALPSSSGDMTYAGCFTDSANRTLSKRVRDVNTPQQCISQCSTWGYNYAGLENGYECWCDMSLQNGGKVTAEKECGMGCRDNKSKCGGGWRLSLYAAKGASVQSVSSVVASSSAITPAAGVLAQQRTSTTSSSSKATTSSTKLATTTTTLKPSSTSVISTTSAAANLAAQNFAVARVATMASSATLVTLKTSSSSSSTTSRSSSPSSTISSSKSSSSSSSSASSRTGTPLVALGGARMLAIMTKAPAVRPVA